jgi:type II secretory pathway pseudopilin PulG
MGSYAVISVLPRGWGVENKRNAFYKTPLIITASVILAIIIVAAIIFLALQRRKIARRKKRHAARMRRKALAAAGLTEDDVRNSDEDAQAKFKERLDELERQYDVRRRSKSKVHHPSAFVRTKVRVWHKGMRKRKNAGATQNADGEKPTESFTTAHVLGGRQSPASSFTASRTSVASSARSSPDGTNPRVTRRGSSTGSPESGHTPETTLVNTNSDAPLSPTASNSRPASSSQPPSTAEPSPQTSPVSGSAEPQYPNLPPAYRPASIHGNGEGSSSSQTPGMRNVAAAAEKVAASGFYPAPATAEAEQAQRIAHRGESKASIIVPPEEEEERERHHVATDDKRQLERLRMGGSAPPVSRVEDEAGPSAPHFEVDDSGFELFPAEGQGQGSSSLTVPRSSPLPSPSLLPAPPSPARLTSLNTFGSFRSADGLLRSVSHGSARDRSLDSAPLSPSVPPMDLDTPSAPPVASSPMLPSAPPPEDEDEGEGETTHVLSAPSAPSAPPLDDLDDGSEYEHEHELECAHESPSAPPAEDEPADDESPDAEAGSRPSSSAGDMHANLGVRGHRFLPRYEP